MNDGVGVGCRSNAEKGDSSTEVLGEPEVPRGGSRLQGKGSWVVESQLKTKTGKLRVGHSPHSVWELGAGSLGLHGNSWMGSWEVDATIKSNVLWIQTLGGEERSKGDVKSEVVTWLG